MTRPSVPVPVPVPIPVPIPVKSGLVRSLVELRPSMVFLWLF